MDYRSEQCFSLRALNQRATRTFRTEHARPGDATLFLPHQTRWRDDARSGRYRAETARNEARTLARQSISERILNAHPHPLDGRTFVVTDEEGHTVLTYPFMDAISD